MKENDFPFIVEALTSDNLSEVKHALVLAVSLIHEMLTKEQAEKRKPFKVSKDFEWIE